MSVYKLAAQLMQDNLATAQAQGFNEQELAKALMNEVIAVYRRERSISDIAHELHFLAENLDEDADYAFMRP
ncbi:hypothetical protein DT594_09625 [Halopseudomonas laoshanensis]|uniref:Uncharacterized protein n=1 Tax=Halopseudomonas laoshanensis TaxID=2268758 RepID=A0A7V7KXB3_9GAMM|nr:hypothetical protein [Halopseudomonas laoshanensis]KAA0695102.1 hypothetical protein DT594_09625 [Halopseudomonas laoshanensis]WOD11979.1 hypothetical protein RPW65_03665 [Pseudomonas sp. NyZ704]